MDIIYEKTLYSTPTRVWSEPPIVKKEPTHQGKFEVYKDKAGEYRFRLKAPNGEVIAVGEGYRTKKSCLNGIQSIMKNAPNAQITELKK